ncbi:GNAT family N-acetyltransferase [Jannaschia sp. R86511]|uniref:GNAT family N-acetyltransferase n=1 Tax=Jannaschia sp. R86511 TaxID=3093853 RepID=UPI0036D35C80
MTRPAATPGDREETAARLVVHPAGADRFDDVRTLLGPRDPQAPACWCLAYRTTSAQNAALTGEDRPGHLRALCERPAAPGVLGYLDDEPVGWCALGPRSEMGRLQRSRTIPVIDDRPVWSVVCFVVRPGYRRRGVAAALLLGAVEHARRHGATTLEGYPVDPEGGRISGSLAYVGTTSLFEGAGFRRVTLTDARSAGLRRWLVRLDLDAPDGPDAPD